LDLGEKAIHVAIQHAETLRTVSTNSVSAQLVALLRALEDANESDQLLDQSGCARLLDLSRQRISQLRSADKFPKPGLQIGETNYWLGSAVLAWYAERSKPSAKIELCCDVADECQPSLVSILEVTKMVRQEFTGDFS
jgi:predicted DNA-binding transcriptional regulator AlpA